MTVGAVIRHPDFARRLAQACDAYHFCPPLHSGRLTWINDRFADRGHPVTVETVRKWVSGENRPRPDKMAVLAAILEADEAWLSLGFAEAKSGDRTVRNAQASGSVNVVAGLIQMDGGHPAFPDDKNGDNPVHLHAIIRGGKYDIHVAVGQETDGGVVFAVPMKADALVVLGMIRDGFNFSIYELTPEIVQNHRRSATPRLGKSIEIMVPNGELAKTRIKSFQDRI